MFATYFDTGKEAVHLNLELSHDFELEIWASHSFHRSLGSHILEGSHTGDETKTRYCKLGSRPSTVQPGILVQVNNKLSPLFLLNVMVL